MSPDEAPTTSPEPTPAQPDETSEDRQASFTRRALLQAGWTAPVILAVALPDRAQAQSHHSDSTFNDGFGDGPPHADHVDSNNHQDTVP